MEDKQYLLLTKQAIGLIENEPDVIANLANLSALISMNIERLNWVGFYFLKDNELVLGPFQGKPACVRIPVGRGVCGTAIATSRTLRVEDVHAFEGHIACDCESRSELVIPFYLNGKPAGVLDLDSPVKGRFSESDELGFTHLIRETEKLLNSQSNV
ncbi:Free methionine-R-sulfoxide reductase [Vibrio aerogenes CECT 7868]|uniref:Free methionine-R-sulfoxide reductase n=1 Tax=Vibrio aerogenes CECT 7868 TaxID=1216006 RepID=A0A1M6E1R6_9VIBR|nr:GAF domain-containing protein [Vibrio aerogenes]SHI79391.1 Free methionine-R-sulfoxide reductase [Vibrio aerogenes CECT 7868]